MEEVVEELVVPLVKGNASFDILSEFTMIPTIIVAEMLGDPKSRYADFRHWSHTLVANLSYGHENEEIRNLILELDLEANDYLAEEIERHRRERPDDVLTAMIEMGKMSEGGIRSTALLLVLAGYDIDLKALSKLPGGSRRAPGPAKGDCPRFGTASSGH